MSNSKPCEVCHEDPPPREIFDCSCDGTGVAQVAYCVCSVAECTGHPSLTPYCGFCDRRRRSARGVVFRCALDDVPVAAYPNPDSVGDPSGGDA